MPEASTGTMEAKENRTRRAAYIELLQRRDFTLLLGAQFVSYMGDTINSIALPLLVLALTGSAVSMAIMLAVRFIPSLLFGLHIAVLVDRIDRRRGMIACDLARAVLVGLLPFARGLWQIYALAGLSALVGLFYFPARRAAVPNLVPGGRLIHANSLFTFGYNVAVLVGPSVGGVLTAMHGFNLAFYLNAASFLLSALATALIRGPMSRARSSQRTRVSSEVLDGLRFISRSPLLRRMMASLFVATIGWAALSVLYALLPARVLNQPDVGYGLIMSAVGGGQLMGALVSPVLGRRYRLFWLMAAAMLLSGACHLLFAISPTLSMAVASVFLAMLALGVAVVVVDTLLQQSIPDRLRGRVLGASGVLQSTSSVVGIAVGGVLAEQFGVLSTGLASGALIMATAVLTLVAWGRTEDHPLPEETATSQGGGTG